jgi:hypothetical protein
MNILNTNVLYSNNTNVSKISKVKSNTPDCFHSPNFRDLLLRHDHTGQVPIETLESLEFFGVRDLFFHPGVRYV